MFAPSLTYIRFALTGGLLAGAALIAPLDTASAQGKYWSSTVDLDVPYVPTPESVVKRMLDIANVGAKDYLIDLGSGDGRIPVTAARDLGARGMGVDLDPDRIKEANENAKAQGVTDKVKFLQQDLFKTEIKDATVLTMYLLPEVNMKLRPRILDELRPGTRIVSHAFHMEDWKPDEEADVNGRHVYFWIVPAKVNGEWKFSGGDAGAMTVHITQEFQQISGVATLNGKKLPLKDALLRGDQIQFTVDVENGPRTFSGRVQGNRIVPGSVIENRGAPGATSWQATKA
jgi:precorrin-6B methylase 2